MAWYLAWKAAYPRGQFFLENIDAVFLLIYFCRANHNLAYISYDSITSNVEQFTTQTNHKQK